MPKYFFKLIDQGEVFHDSEGQMLEDDEVARHEAGIALSEIAREVLAVDGLAHEFEIVVSNEKGEVVWTTKLDFEAVAGSAHQ
ncbi:DUF6894 family protein [Devosia sp. CN2-171]|jgi:hypothetical protein|uniref:DUF6894 family protein n=1 Tax=Devosia sp. CN2-171 TaxID=3400909 RepID=UPI003BF8F87A